MGHALIIAVLFGSTLLAQAEPLDRDKWVGQTARANRTCLAKFRGKFGKARTTLTLLAWRIKPTRRSMPVPAIVSFPIVFASDR